MTVCHFTGQHPDAGEGVTDRFADHVLVMGAEGLPVCREHAEQYAGFNPHGERTSDGTLIVPGLRVLDYNRNVGTVVEDRDATEYKCRAVNPDVTAAWSNPDADPPCHNGWGKPTHWFTVEGVRNVGGGMFDGSRMQALR